MLAPGAASSASTYIFPASDRRPSTVPPPSADSEPYSGFPAVDDHLVQPEVSKEEIIRGRRVQTMGANKEHAEAHLRADFLISPHVVEGRVAATDLLTRVNEGSNFATDVSIRREGLDPRTGKRYLEEVSFEVVNEQSLRNATEKAEDLMARGIRRFFGIFVKRNEVREWSREKNAFVTLPIDGVIVDPTLIRPISVRALLDRAHAELEVAKALIQKNNPVIVQLKQHALDEGHKKGIDEGHKKGIDEGHKKGIDEGGLQGRRAVLRELLEDEFGELDSSVTSRIATASIDQLRGWTKKLRHATSVEDVFIVDGASFAG